MNRRGFLGALLGAPAALAVVPRPTPMETVGYHEPLPPAPLVSTSSHTTTAGGGNHVYIMVYCDTKPLRRSLQAMEAEVRAAVQRGFHTRADILKGEL